MAEFDDTPPPLDDDDFLAKKTPWGKIVAVVLFVGLAIFIFWISREKKNEKARAAVLEILNKELDSEQAAVNAQRQKVMDLTHQLETLRAQMQQGQAPKGSVAQYNLMAAQQRTERTKFAQMAEEYNKKVAKYRNIQE